MSRIEFIIIQSHDQVSNMLFTLDLLAKKLQQIFKIVIKVLLKSINHPVIIVFFYAFFDVLTFKQNLLLSSSDGINQMSVVLIFIIVLEMILVQDMLIFSHKIINNLPVRIVIILFTWRRKEPDNNSGKEMRSQINMIYDSMNLLVSK